MTGQGGGTSLEVDPRGVAWLTLDRAGRHNALDAAMMDGLASAAARLSADPAIRVVVLGAAGESFCAGGDLVWMRAQIAAEAPARTAEARRLAAMLRALNDLPMPLIARVQGPAYGGGLGLIAVCDSAIAVETARFGMTETRLGLIPATIGPYVAARIGAAARRVLPSPRFFGADEAQRLGLLSHVVAPQDLDAAVAAEVAPILSAAPGAVAAAKSLARALGPRIDDATVEASILALIARWESPEAAEGIAAFLERRRPGWTPTQPS